MSHRQTIEALPLLRRAVLLCSLILAAAGAPSRPAAAQDAPLNTAGARPLLARRGFAAPPGGVGTPAGLGRDAAVVALLSGAGERAVTPPPAWVADWTPPRVKQMSETQRLALRATLRDEAAELKTWWLREMLETPTPITEVMTLFWHSHFTSSLEKVKAPALLYRQNVLLRRHALGNFAELLRAVARDPAMLIYLDNARSRRQAPNENFARELMELFTLGEGHYTEADLKEAARAFTGWSLDPDSGEFTFRPRWHDGGEKRILGRRGAFDGDDVVGLLLARPETAELIVTKLWRAFISETPDPAEVRRLAAVFRDAGYEIKPLLAALFTSEAFWAEENRGRLVKSPVDFVVGSLRLFDLPVREDRDLAWMVRRLGQDLFDPPDVKGWPGGTHWITGATLLDRQALIARVTGAAENAAMTKTGAGQNRRAAFFDRWAAQLPEDWQDARAVTLLVLAVPPVDVQVLDRRASGALVRSLLADPAYHVK
ncbi:DUF1800 domain-containing protein [Pelagibius marinus]|uniref:DUF1800 domain-containing protein n=1 Tax=Pelagibius marinus TaxID=2762760 RepID=UPI001D04E668|nr:DUF1800 domain-containing protein [Pelagibius marinus]